MKRLPVKRWWIVLSVAAVAAVAAVAVSRGGGNESASTTWVEVERRDLDREVVFTGRLHALKVAEYGPPALTQTREFRLMFIAPEGSEVEAGEPVLRFDTSEIEQDLRRHVAERDTAERQYAERRKEFEAQMNEQQLALDEARAQGRRAQISAEVPADLVARSTLEKAAIDLALAKEEVAHRGERIAYLKRRSQAELAVLRDRRDRAAAAIAEAEQSIGLLTVRARSAGVVLHRAERRGQKKKVGDTCWRGERVVEIPETGAMRVDAWIPEPYSAGLVVGLPAKLWLDAQPDRELSARVASVQQTVERRSDLDEGPIVRLELSLESADLARVRPGMRGHGRIVVEERDGRLAVPIAAVEGGSSGPVVTRKALFGGGAPRSVELGGRSGSWVEVAAGLDEGDRVMVRR